MTAPHFPATLPDGAIGLPEDPIEPEIDFTPVPRLRNRRSGWTEARQRGFIAALALCGSVCAAAREVGMAPRGAYRLLDAEGADSFAEAWDQAADLGLARIRGDALERAMHGEYVPIYKRGLLIRVEHRRKDKLALALISARRYNVDDNYGVAVRRREHHARLAELRERDEAQRRADVEWAANYRRELEEMLEKARQLRLATLPRIRSL